MSGRAAEINQPPFGEQDDALAVGEDDVIDLRLDVVPGIGLQRGDFDLVVEVADVADDGVVLHATHVLVGDHVDVACCGHENVCLVAGVIHGDHAIAFHRGLERADRIDLGHPDLSGERAQRLRRALAHVAIAVHDCDLARDHHVRCALDAVDQRFAAAVEIVEFGLRDRIVDVDRGETERSLLVHLVEALHPRRRFLGYAPDLTADPGIEMRIGREAPGDRGEQRELFLVRRMRNHRAIAFRLHPQVHEQSRVAAIVENHVRPAFVGPFEDAVRELPVLVERFALECEHWRAGGRDRRRGMILRRINVARRPADFRAERLERFDQHCGLDRHMQRAGNAGPAQRLLRGELFADRHQTGHLGLGDCDLLAPPGGEVEIGDIEIGEVAAIGHGVHRIAPCRRLGHGERSFARHPARESRSTSAVAKSEGPRAWQGGTSTSGRPVATLLEEL